MPLVAIAQPHIADESAEDARARILSLGAARGDPAAVADFFDSWFDWTLNAAARATARDESFCLDVVQEIMVRVAGKMPPLLTHADMERWMWRVVYNAAMDALRSERRRTRRERVSQSGARVDATDDAQIEWITRELGRLSADDQLLVRARFGGAMTLREIGTSLGRSTGSIHGRLRRILASLRDRRGDIIREDEHVD